MNPWVFIGITILILIVAVVLFSLVFTWLILKLSDRHVHKTVEAHAKKTAKLMPGTNCGKCGYDSCFECAKAIVSGQESPNACKEGGDELTEKLFAAVVEFQEATKRPEDPQPRKRSRFSRDFTEKG